MPQGDFERDENNNTIYIDANDNTYRVILYNDKGNPYYLKTDGTLSRVLNPKTTKRIRGAWLNFLAILIGAILGVIGTIFAALTNQSVSSQICQMSLSVTCDPGKPLVVTADSEGTGDEISDGLLTPVNDISSFCYGRGDCWVFDDANRTMIWTGLNNGHEDVWQGPGNPLSKIREGYTAILGPMDVPGEIYACVLVVNGESVSDGCRLYPVAAGILFRITSQDRFVGGFRWCPTSGNGWRSGESTSAPRR